MNSNIYFNIWVMFIPISSIVLIPSIKGTLPSYLFSALSIFFVFLFSKKYRTYYSKDLMLFLFVFVFDTLAAQLGLLVYGINFDKLILVDPYDYTIFFRSTIVTQFLYLLMGYLTYLFVKRFYHKKFDKPIFYSALLLALYGIYEVIYFAVFNESGDFLSNRLFGDMQSETGSLFQTINLGGILFQRLKSLTGEPSMFALTMLPFWIYAIHKKRFLYQSIFLTTLILSTSTTAILGIVIYLLIRIIYLGLLDAYLFRFLVIFSFLCTLCWELLYDLWTSMIIEKLIAENVSGMERSGAMIGHLQYFLDMPTINQFFGIGFGYIRSTDLLTTLLVNNGLIGFIIFSFFFLYPVWKLNSSYENVGLKAILIVLYFVMMVAVPEFSYLSTWLFLGIAYNQISHRQARKG